MTFPALLAHSSPPLRLWRFAGGVFLVAQAISDSLSLRDTWKAKHIVEQCLLDGAPRIVDGVECNRCITKAWQKAARSRRPFTSFTRVPPRELAKGGLFFDVVDRNAPRRPWAIPSACMTRRCMVMSIESTTSCGGTFCWTFLCI